MAYSSIAAQHVGKYTRDKHTKDGRASCMRCGFVRAARSTSPLCKDCRSTMTADERKAWGAK